MSSTIARGSAGNDFAALGDEILQRSDVFVVDFQRFVGAEPAYLATSARPPTHPRTAFSRPPFVGATFATVFAASTTAATRTAFALARHFSRSFDVLFVGHLPSLIVSPIQH